MTSRSAGRSLILLLVAAAPLMSSCRKQPKPQAAHPTADSVQVKEARLKNGMPEVVEATATPLDSAEGAGAVLLQVRFAPGFPLDSTVTIRPEDRPIVLRDDGTKGDSAAGDRVFSAIERLDLRVLADEQRSFARRSRGARAIPQFVHRVRVDSLVLPRELTGDFRRFVPRRPFPLFPLGVSNQLLIDRSVMILDPVVVADPGRTVDPCTGAGAPAGVWTFGHLMTEMANQSATGVSPADFARSWLAQWETVQTINGFPIQPRAQGITSNIITPWETASGGPGAPLDLAKAPFRLLAIVNRVDLRQNLVYGGGSAGEARFVFGAVKRTKAGCSPLRFAVIFEYGINKRSCQDVKAWGKQWADLAALPPSGASYRAALEAITEQFVHAGADPSQSPNQSALNQLRTNEIALAGPWELREFTLASTGAAAGRLASVTVKREPDRSFNNGTVLAQYVNSNAGVIVQDKHDVPLSFPGAADPFLGSSAPVPDPSFFWGRGSDMTAPNSRFHFSLNTCSGCHGGETSTPFTHISPTSGLPAALSGFLTGNSVLDPDLSDTDNSTRSFGDLERRAIDLDGLVNSSCLRQITVRPINFMVH